jgi:hypothetical protein
MRVFIAHAGGAHREPPLGFAEASFAVQRQLGVESEAGFGALVQGSRDPRVMGLARSVL